MGARAYCLVLAAAFFPLTGVQAGEANASTPTRHERIASVIPEPSNLVLLAAGVAGLIIGRRGSRSRRRKDDAE